MNQMIENHNYWSDHRVRASMVSGPFESIDEKRMVGVLKEMNGIPDGTEVPLKYEVCSTCQGKGTHVNPSIDCCGLSAEDFREDPDFAQDYFSGMYDQPCNECGGKRVTPEIDYDKTPDDIIAAYDRWIKDEIEYAAMCAAERRMGA